MYIGEDEVLERGDSGGDGGVEIWKRGQQLCLISSYVVTTPSEDVGTQALNPNLIDRGAMKLS